MTMRLLVPAIVSAVVLASVLRANADTKTALFGYDANGRLTTSMPADNKCTLWAYDANGNRISQQTVSADPSPPTWGQVNWGAVNWTSGAVTARWGSGAWGCIHWTPP